MHSENFQKTELFLGLNQLITLNVAFREEYLIEHLSVIARWNRNEKIYRMGWLYVSFSDPRRHGANLPFSHIKKNILIEIEEGKVLHD